jgi:hypothetical protein
MSLLASDGFTPSCGYAELLIRSQHRPQCECRGQAPLHSKRLCKSTRVGLGASTDLFVEPRDDGFQCVDEGEGVRHDNAADLGQRERSRHFLPESVQGEPGSFMLRSVRTAWMRFLDAVWRRTSLVRWRSSALRSRTAGGAMWSSARRSVRSR